MRKAGKLLLLLPLLALAVSGVAAADTGELNLRQRLLENRAVETLYSVDELTTLFTASGSKEAVAAIGELCGAKGASLASVDNVLKCGDAFSAEAAGGEGRSYLIKSAAAEPIAYKTPWVPPYEEIETPPDGEMEGAFEGIDMYQYMYALCKKGNGKAFTVISRRAGRSVRLVEASPEEAFRHLFSSGNSKDPWFFACEGETKFIVEKDYGYSPDDKGKFSFHQNRGLEWVDFIRSGDREELARLDSFTGELQSSSHDPALLASLAREVASFRSDMVKASNGARYEGHFMADSKREGCDLVSIKYNRPSDDGSQTFNYRVCGYNAAAIDSTDLKKNRVILELFAGK